MTQKYTDIDDENDGEGHERNVLLHQSMVPMPMWKVTAEINPEGTFKIDSVNERALRKAADNRCIDAAD